MNLKALYKEFITDIKNKSELKKLMKEMSRLSHEIGMPVEQKLVYYDAMRDWHNRSPNREKIQFFGLLKLIHILCNKEKVSSYVTIENEDLLYTKINKTDYILPFPILNIQDDDKQFFNFNMNYMKFKVFKNKPYMGLEEYTNTILTKDYAINQNIKSNKTTDCIIIPIGEFKQHSKQEMLNIVLKDMRRQVLLLQHTGLFYQGLDGICNNVIDKKILDNFIDLLKNKKDLLKILTLFPNIELQTALLSYFEKLNIEITTEDPIHLLCTAKEQIIDWEQGNKYEDAKNEGFKNDMDLLINKFKREKNNSEFYKLLLAFKLDKESRGKILTKRPKI